MKELIVCFVLLILLLCVTDIIINNLLILKGKLKNNNLDDNIFIKDKMLNLKEELPKLWDYDFFKDKNHATTSSSIIHKNIIKDIGYMTEVPNWGKYKGLFQDWEYWKRISKKYNCLYINEPLVIWFKHKKGLTI